MDPTYYVGSDLPDLAVTWKDTSGAVIDFSTGHTFQLKVGDTAGGAALFTKTTGITGAASAPNVTVAWATAGELNGLADGSYIGQLKATRTSDGKERLMQFRFVVRAAIN